MERRKSRFSHRRKRCPLAQAGDKTHAPRANKALATLQHPQRARGVVPLAPMRPSSASGCCKPAPPPTGSGARRGGRPSIRMAEILGRTQAGLDAKRRSRATSSAPSPPAPAAADPPAGAHSTGRPGPPHGRQRGGGGFGAGLDRRHHDHLVAGLGQRPARRMCTDALAERLSSGRTRASVAAPAPAMIAQVVARVPVPPDTGASTQLTPRVAWRSASARRRRATSCSCHGTAPGAEASRRGSLRRPASASTSALAVTVRSPPAARSRIRRRRARRHAPGETQRRRRTPAAAPTPRARGPQRLVANHRLAHHACAR